MFFQHINALVQSGVNLQIEVAAATDNRLSVTVSPVNSGKATGLIPKAFTATAAEFDEGFAAIMAGFATANLTLAEQLAQLTQQAEEAAKLAQASAKSKVKSGAKAPIKLTSSTDTDDDNDGEDDTSTKGAGAITPVAAVEDEPESFVL